MFNKVNKINESLKNFEITTLKDQKKNNGDDPKHSRVFKNAA